MKLRLMKKKANACHQLLFLLALLFAVNSGFSQDYRVFQKDLNEAFLLHDEHCVHEHSQHQVTDTSDTVGCATASWSPEVLQFYGGKNDLLDKLSKVTKDVTDSRLYIGLLESDTNAEFVLFERDGKSTYSVYTWNGKSLGDFSDRAAFNILANEGIACIGDQVKWLAKNRYDLKWQASVPAPVSVKAAFSHRVKDKVEDYYRLTLYLLC